jgi:hypothetical protein
LSFTYFYLHFFGSLNSLANPKSSLKGLINALKRRNIIKKHEYGITNVFEPSEGLYQKNKTNKAYFILTFGIEIKYRSIQVGMR